MAINFPSSPTNGQIHYDPNSGNRYFFDSVAGRWVYAANNEPFPIASDTEVLFNNAGGIDGQSGLTFNPTSNTLFTNTINVSANIYAGFFVGSGSALTDINAVTISNTAPTPAQAGDLWWDPNRGRFFIYYDDGTSTQWVETSPTGSGGGGGGGSTDLSPVYFYANGIYDLANAAFNRANTSNDVLFVISSYDTANQAYTVANAAFSNANLTLGVAVFGIDLANTANAKAGAAYDVANAAFSSANNVAPQVAPSFNTANAAFDKANTVALDLANTAIAANNYAGAMANSANAYAASLTPDLSPPFNVANAAFDKANSANVLAYDTGIGANAYASNVGVSANAYTVVVGDSANNYAGAMANSANAYTDYSLGLINTFFNTVIVDVANSINSYANQIGTSGNSYAQQVGASSNTYANVVGDSANAYANLIGQSANSYSEQVASAANNYAGAMVNSSNAYANSTYYLKSGGTIAGDVVITGNLIISGETTYANTQTLLIGDNIVTLNADLPNTVASAANAGIEINRGSAANVSLYWEEINGVWSFIDNGGSVRRIVSADDLSTVNTFVTAARTVADAGFDKANSANVLAYQTGIGANNYAGAMANSSNAYVDYTVINVIAPMVSGNLNTSRAYTNTSTESSNNYAGFMANSVNTFTSATYSTLTQWSFSFTVANAAYTVANAAFGYANNLGYYAGNNGDKGNAAGLGDIFRVHSNTLTQNVTIYSGNNALAAGPITVASGRTLAIQTGARLAIV